MRKQLETIIEEGETKEEKEKLKKKVKKKLAKISENKLTDWTFVNT